MNHLKVLAVVGLFVSTNSFALHEFSCSTATAALQIQEAEIWGANPVGCSYKGEQIENAKATLEKSTVKVVEGKVGKPGADWKAVYAVKGKIARTDGHALTTDKGAPKEAEGWFICKESSSSALDLVAPKKHCEVSWK